MKPQIPSPSSSSKPIQKTDSKQNTVTLTPFVGSNPSNLPIQNKFVPLSNYSTQTQTTYSQLIQRPVVVSPTTPSKKETLVT